MISINDLSFSYPKAKESALKGINLTLAPGSAHALLGPNGAGKTTLISLIAGILPMQAGQLFIDGINARTHRNDIQRFMSLVPQEYAFYPRLTGLENLHFFAGMQGLSGTQRNRCIEEAIAFVDLEKYLKEPASRYSGGLKRRLNLAIALLNKPKLLILDEPTVGLDPQTRSYIVERLNQLRSQGVTLIYTSHLLDEVQRLCDQLILIDHGKILLQSSMALAIPQQAGRRISITTDKTFASEALGLPPPEIINDYSDQVETVWLCEPTTAPQFLQQALKQLSNQPFNILSAKLDDARLEDVFLALTNTALRE